MPVLSKEQRLHKFIGEHPNWVSNRVLHERVSCMLRWDLMTYKSKHETVGRLWGKANHCEKCERPDLNRYEWSNKDHKYGPLRDEWQQLCHPCHAKYDIDTFGHRRAWNSGNRKIREHIICKCGKEFYPIKDSVKSCSYSCARLGNKNSIRKIDF